jgi:hypothetical protein
LEGKVWKAWMVVVLLCVAGCRASHPSSPSNALDGTWTGTLAPDGAGTGQLTLTLRQVGAGVSGEWTATFADAALTRAGSVSGTVMAAAVSLFLTPQVGINCGSVMLSGTLGATATLDADHISGRYTVLTCGSATGGTIDVTRTGG